MFRQQTLAVLLLLSVKTVLAQDRPAGPTFEAASVKMVQPGTNGGGRMHGGPGTNSPGLLTGWSTLKVFLMQAYDLKPYQISGPAWMESERYEINAKIPAGASKAQVAEMLQSLLQERFHLVVRREMRELPVYALVVGKNGPKLKEADSRQDPFTPAVAAAPRLTKGVDGLPELAPGADVARSYEVVIGGSDGALHKLWARHEKMQQLAERLSGQLNRAVVDSTGLTGTYNFTLVWSIESAGGMIPRTDPPPDQIETSSSPVLADRGVSVFSALQEQLGLKLEPKRQALAMLIIEGADKIPTEN